MGYPYMIPRGTATNACQMAILPNVTFSSGLTAFFSAKASVAMTVAYACEFATVTIFWVCVICSRSVQNCISPNQLNAGEHLRKVARAWRDLPEYGGSSRMSEISSPRRCKMRCMCGLHVRSACFHGIRLPPAGKYIFRRMSVGKFRFCSSRLRDNDINGVQCRMVAEGNRRRVVVFSQSQTDRDMQLLTLALAHVATAKKAILIDCYVSHTLYFRPWRVPFCMPAVGEQTLIFFSTTAPQISAMQSQHSTRPTSDTRFCMCGCI